jgi:signal transduction histidine kinase/DNA-binding LacI/PurR family transcriptional regulator
MSENVLRFALICELEASINSEGYLTEILSGINITCQNRNIELVSLAGGSWMRSPYNIDEPARNTVYRLIRKEDLDGLIMLSTVTAYASEKENKDFYQLIEGIPIVCLGMPNRDLSYVMTNNASGILQLVDHLVDVHGHRSFAFIAGPPENTDSIERLSAFKKGLKAHGLPVRPEMIQKGDFLPGSGEKGAFNIIQQGLKPDVIIAANDLMAMGAIKKLKQQNIKVPDDIAVVGFDNSKIIEAANPPLTTIAQPFQEVAETAVSMLIKLVQTGHLSKKRIVLDSQLVIRNSCGCNFSYNIQYIENHTQSSEESNNLIKYFIEVIAQELGAEKLALEIVIKELRDFIQSGTLSDQSTLFINIQNLLNSGAHSSFSYIKWMEFFTRLYSIVTGGGNQKKPKFEVNHFFNQIILLLADRRQISDTGKRLEIQSQIEIMSNFSRVLFRSNSLTEVCENLFLFFRDIGCSFCQFYLFPSAFTGVAASLPKTISEDIYCVLSIKDGIRQLDEMPCIKTKEILSRKILPLENVGSVTVEILFSGEKKIGIFVVQQNFGLSYFYKSLRDSLSTILMEIHSRLERDSANDALQKTLVKLENAHNELEKKVEERTADYKKAKEEAEKANRMKSEFLANVSHELRTPMHAVLSYSDFGIKKIDKISKEKTLHYFNQIRSSGLRLKGFVDNLLDLSSLESGKTKYNMTPIDLKKVIFDVASELQLVLKEKELHLKINLSSDSIAIKADAIKIVQLLQNLISNAIKFSPDGGKITVSECEDAMVPQKYISDHNKISFVCIRICDEGIGIPEGELDSIFDKFVQSSKTDTGAGGTGLGLSICQEIVKAHHGSIWADNNKIGGSDFYFALPLFAK